MRKKMIIPLIIFIFLVLSFGAIGTFALYRDSTQASGSLAAAEWSVTRNQSASGDSLMLIPEIATDNYNLTVTSTSEVDIKYKVIISNLSAGVEVALDNGSYQSAVNNTITFNNVGVINYNDASKTKNHILHFRAVNGATLVTDREIDIDVLFSQVV